jgi:thymidylate synthase
MALPPCHVSYQFYVDKGVLSCHMYQRSSDIFLGLPFNIASTALLVHLIAHETDLTPGTVRLSIGDAHLYTDHIGVATIQMNRVPYAFPTLKINRKKDGLWNIQLEEIELENYRHHPRLKAEMAV